MAFVKATKKKVKLKLAITGPGGSGKTMSALRLAHGMGGKVALIDTENESASLYSDRYGFDVNNIKPPFTNEKFVEAINEAVQGGYDTVIIDSASHIWEGILDYKSKMDARGGNSYTNWNEAGKKFKDVLDAVLQSPLHVICCMRSKQEYVLETNDRGKQVPKKVGLAPIMRDGIEYEFTTVFDVDMTHHAKTSKDRTGLFSDNIFQITEDTGKQLISWMGAGAIEVKSEKVDLVTGEKREKQVDWRSEANKEYHEQVGTINAKLKEALPDWDIKVVWKRMSYTDPDNVVTLLQGLLEEVEADPANAKAKALAFTDNINKE